MMFIGLMNSIDQRNLTHCQKKLVDIKQFIDIATCELNNLKGVQQSLRQNHRSGAGSSEIYCNKTWVGFQQVDSFIKMTEARIDDLTRVQYEKYGTKCATLRRRIAARDAKIAGRQLSGSSIV